MVCVAAEGYLEDCMGCQTDSNSRPGLPYEFSQSRSPTDGTALPLVFNACFSLPKAPSVCFECFATYTMHPLLKLKCSSNLQCI